MYLNLGVGPGRIHQQHLDIMLPIAPIEKWTLVDKFVIQDGIENWDAEVLDEVPNGSVDVIYTSHLLEHISHRNLVPVLEMWFDKLKPGGRLIINVPDMEWAARQILRFESGQILSGVYSDFEGERGLQSVVYGTHAHDGEHHKACFVRTSLWELLDGVGYEKIKIEQFEDAHDMGVLLARCEKPKDD
jgi:2-polyprenyl-3-methyl-5-hydroxy-6-metoxy-1,4-benzoquinol methylase